MCPRTHGERKKAADWRTKPSSTRWSTHSPAARGWCAPASKLGTQLPMVAACQSQWTALHVGAAMY